MYAWDELGTELRDDLEHDLDRGLLPATLALGYDGPELALAMQTPPFALEDADAIVDRIVDVFHRFPSIRRFAAAWPVRYEASGPAWDDLRSADGGVWALLVTRGVLDRRDRASWRCSLRGFRFDPDGRTGEVADEETDVPIEALANPYPRRLRAVLDPARHERLLADPYLDTRPLEDEGYDLRLRPDVAAGLVRVDEARLTTVDGRLWPRAALS